MKKNVIIPIIIAVVIFFVIAVVATVAIVGIAIVSNNQNNDNNYSSSSSDNKTNLIDHTIYKYIKISSSGAGNMLYSVESAFGSMGTVSNGDIQYNPCILAEFDTATGNATKATFYCFFLDYDNDEWVNKAIGKYNSASSRIREIYTNVKKGRVDEHVSYLSAEINLEKYEFTQYLDSYIIKNQDIEKYKDKVYFSRLYNYSTTPTHEEGANYFSETLEGIRIEWSDSEIKAYDVTNNTRNDNNTNTISNTITNTIDNTLNTNIVNETTYTNTTNTIDNGNTIGNTNNNIKYEIIKQLPYDISFDKKTKGQEFIEFENNYYVIIKMGTKNTGGYSIDVEKVEIKDNKVDIYVKETEPTPGSMVTMEITYPYIAVKFNTKQNVNVIYN